MSLKGIAKETLQILEKGEFISRHDRVINFATEQKLAEKNTKLYRPEEVENLLQNTQCDAKQSLLVEVTDETSQAAAYRLVKGEGCHDLALLNYASARNPGGGFINGAKAQEEDLARCSGLYPCQLTQPEYYQANRSQDSLLYTDYLIYSPKVPWFRIRSRELLDDYFLASVITAPAPNAGQVLRRDPNAIPDIEKALRRRAGYVLAVAQDNGHRSLLLGAWGCGVFCNDASMVADAFGQWLESPRFHGCFDRVVFGIYDSAKSKDTLKAFKNRFLK
ncbi:MULTISPECIES: TIGR02452 family protein [unclassified Microcoleus]|uniref:TIGR02452 family protein n=1 Tax=unclassified Microcoleus TaxID=2642155 RepID=UPI002FD15F5E